MRPGEKAHGPIVEIRKGLEVEVSGVKPRKNQFKEALDAKREALTRAANQPKPAQEPEWEPETPELRARTLGVEQSELISRLNTLTTKKRKA